MTEQSLTWILIANASKARLYAVYKAKLFQADSHPDDFKLIDEFSHEESRMKNRELVSDKMGEFGAATFGEATPPKALEAEQFAQQLITMLEAARKTNSFRDIILIASPTFMGMLCKQMPNELQKTLNQKIEKDYVHLQGQQLLQALVNHF